MLLSSFRVSIDTLRANPLRTFLSTLGIVIGVAALVAVLSLADGLEGYARNEIGQTTDLQAIGVSPRRTHEVDGVTLPLESVVQWTPAEVAALAAGLPKEAIAGLTEPVYAVTTVDGTARAVEVLGTTPSLFASQGIVADSGRVFGSADEASRVILLTHKAARALAPAARDALRVGDSVTLGPQRLAIIGLLGGEASGTDIAAVVPIQAAAMYAKSGTTWAPSMIVRAARVEDGAEVRAGVERWLASRYGAAWTQRVEVASRTERVQQTAKGMLILKLVMGSITSICLLVGGIGVMNVLLASVVERTREIGIRRAVGASRRDILVQFLAESVTISSVGSVAGVLLGLAGSYGITAVIRAVSHDQIRAGFSVGTIAVAVLATVFVGLTFGIYPALTASRLSPIEAIRHE